MAKVAPARLVGYGAVITAAIVVVLVALVLLGTFRLDPPHIPDPVSIPGGRVPDVSTPTTSVPPRRSPNE